MIKKHIGIFRQVPPDTSEDKKERLLEEVIENAKIVQDYWRRYARHIWDVQVRGYLMVGTESTLPPTYARNDIRKYIESHDMEGFEPTHFHVHGGFNPNACGHGNLPGNRSSTYLSYAGCGVKTMIHELGHNFGLYHASTRKPDGSWSMYGDGTSIMGSSTYIRGLNGPNLINLHLEDDREILEIDHTQQILLAPVELSKHSLRPNEYQHARIRKNITTYHFSIRKMHEKGGFYFNGKDPETLYIHEAPSREKSMRILPDMVPGDTQLLTDGTKIEYLEYSDECARVNVYYNKNDPAPESIGPMPDDFPPVMPTLIPSDRVNGLWYNKDFNGEGFDVQIREGKAVVYWYTYNQKDDSRRFYYGLHEKTDSNILEFPLYTTKSGTWEDPTEREAVLQGKARLYFLDEKNAIFLYNTEDHGRGSVELVPAALSVNNPLNGVFYNKARDGEGFTMQFFEDLNSCVVNWFSYGPKKPRSYDTPPGAITEQRWYHCQGKRVNGAYMMTVYESSGNTWMQFRDDSNVHPIGTAEVRVIDNDNIAFKFNINGDGVDGADDFLLERLF